jgi:hypothetical protein
MLILSSCGDDGPWSTLSITLGNQSIHVLPSLYTTDIITIPKEGCDESLHINNCGFSRGGLFGANKSSTWIPTNKFTDTSDLSNTVNRLSQGAKNPSVVHESGIDLIGFNQPGILPKNWYYHNISVRRISNLDPYVGLIGLGSSIDDSIPSLLDTLLQENIIKTHTWSYTAGTKRDSNNPTLSSLVFGGYNSSRCDFTNAQEALKNSFTFKTRNLYFNLLGIDISSMMSNNSYSSTDTIDKTGVQPISTTSAYLDSTTPFIHIPAYFANKLAEHLGLTWDPEREMFPISSNQKGALERDWLKLNFTLYYIDLNGKNTKMSFTFNNPVTSFTFQAEYPFVQYNKDTISLAVKPAENPQSIILGRAFQQMCMMANYGNSKFMLTPTFSKASQPGEIKLFDDSSGGTGNFSGNNSTATGSKENTPSLSRVSKSQILGVVFGVGILITVVTLVILFCLRRRKKRRQAAELDAQTETVNGNGRQVVELYADENEISEMGINDQHDIRVAELQGDIIRAELEDSSPNVACSGISVICSSGEKHGFGAKN